MDKSIYRFRSIDKVLSTEDLDSNAKGFDELRKQQIYFSSLHELNDPMEGYKEIYWERFSVQDCFSRHSSAIVSKVFSALSNVCCL